MKKLKTAFFTCLLLAMRDALCAEVVVSCQVGVDRARSIQLTKNQVIDDSGIYSLRKNGDGAKFLYAGDREQSRGMSVEAACVGASEHVLVISGEFTSNYIQGSAIRFNTSLKRWQRIDFAERERPATVYLGESDIFVVIPNLTKNESHKKYIIYHLNDQTRNRPRQIYSDSLPNGNLSRIDLPEN